MSRQGYLRQRLGPARKWLTDCFATLSVCQKPKEYVANNPASESELEDFFLLQTKMQRYADTYRQFWNKYSAGLKDDEFKEKTVLDELQTHTLLQQQLDEYTAIVDWIIGHRKRTFQKQKEVLDTEMQREILLNQSKLTDLSSTTESNNSRNAPASTHLPKRHLLEFDGDLLKWKAFWDNFQSAVHNNVQLSKADKLDYLVGQLRGEAAQAIEGYAVTDDNYELVKHLLENFYGDKDRLVQAHYTRISNLERVDSNDLKTILHFYDQIETQLRSIEAMQYSVEHGMVFAVIWEKFPRSFQHRLEERLTDQQRTVANLRKAANGLLNVHRFTELQRPVSAKTDKSTTKKIETPKTITTVRTTSSLTTAATSIGPTTKNRERSCIFCTSTTHWTDDCDRFPTIETRSETIKGKRCFNCLGPGHTKAECRSIKACVYCRRTKDHHRSLCAMRGQLNISTRIGNPPPIGNNTTMVSTMLASGQRVQLQTARTLVRNDTTNDIVSARLILDSGSQRSYVSQALAQRLRTAGKRREMLSVFTFGQNRPSTISTAVIELSLQFLDGSFRQFSFNVVPQLTGPITETPVDKSKWNALYSTLHFADPDDDIHSPIEILIGNDYYLDIITLERIEIRPGFHLLGSQFGWIYSGRINNSSFDDTTTTLFAGTSIMNIDDSPDDNCPLVKPALTKLWDLDCVGLTDNPIETDDDVALTSFNNSVNYNSVSNRYVVRFPWKSDLPVLPDNYGLAYGRLKSLWHQLKDKPELLSQYDGIFAEQLKFGIIERLPADVPDTVRQIHYLAHHAVVSPSHSTKVRIVFDGSAKANKQSCSINECLHRGPVLLTDLCHLLIRFRMHRIVLTADIEKAFLQLEIATADRDVTRFLWLIDPRRPPTYDNVEIFRFARVPFGLICSPFLLAATTTYHLKRYNSATADQIANDMYVDNLISGVPDVDTATEFYRTAKGIFHDASMNLRDWNTNSEELRNHIPELNSTSNDSTKVLGLKWNPTTDSIQLSSYNKTVPATNPVTKRTVTSAISSVFDPLGMLAPSILPGKLLLHELWVNKHSWDEQLPDDLRDAWTTYEVQLQHMSSVDIPRYIGLTTTGTNDTTYELHAFCDASKLAYGAAIYLRIVSSTETRSFLAYSRVRLTPNRSITIPRLELLASWIGTKLLKFTAAALTVPILRQIVWTDSSCVYFWFHSKKQLATFVTNRLNDIRSCGCDEICHVKSDQNPADILSRGCSVEQLRGDSLWWSGPSWLQEQENCWPTTSFVEDEEVNKTLHSEYRKTNITLSSIDHDQRSIIQFERYSKLLRLSRTIAYVLRFIHNCRPRTTRYLGPLSVQELTNAQRHTDCLVQLQSFSAIFRALKNGTAHQLVRQLGVFIDDQGLLRCRT